MGFFSDLFGGRECKYCGRHSLKELVNPGAEVSAMENLTEEGAMYSGLMDQMPGMFTKKNIFEFKLD